MPNLLSESQSDYVNNRYVTKDGSLILDILEFTDSLQINGLLMIVDLETAFESANYFFLIFTRKRYGLEMTLENGLKHWLKTKKQPATLS